MNLLLTGASGFLGRNFLRRAPEDWRIIAVYRRDLTFPHFVSTLKRPTVTPVRCDLGDTAEVAAFAQQHGREWDSCLYLSAKVDIPWSVTEPKQDLIANAAPLLNLLEAIHTQRFVYFSSGAVYDGLRGEVSPDVFVSPTLPYAITKLACEAYVRFYHARRRSIDQWLLVRFFGAYGPYEAPHKIHSRLVRTFALEGKNSYTIYGDGQNLIDAMYVDDAADAIHHILTGSHWNTTLDLCSGHPLTIEALVHAAGEALGLAPVQVKKLGLAHENIQFRATTRAIHEHYGFTANTPLAEGISRLRDFLLLAR